MLIALVAINRFPVIKAAKLFGWFWAFAVLVINSAAFLEHQPKNIKGDQLPPAAIAKVVASFGALGKSEPYKRDEPQQYNFFAVETFRKIQYYEISDPPHEEAKAKLGAPDTAIKGKDIFEHNRAKG